MNSNESKGGWNPNLLILFEVTIQQSKSVPISFDDSCVEGKEVGS